MSENDSLEAGNGAPEHGDAAAARTPVREREMIARARSAAGGRLEGVAGRVRQMGDDAAARNKLLKPTRSIAYRGAEGIDHAAEYVRTREVDQMRSDLEETVRRHPLASIALAFFAGYTLRRII